jgi:hypothetical protein
MPPPTALLDNDFTILAQALLRSAYLETNDVSSGVAPILLFAVNALLKVNQASLFRLSPQSVHLSIEDLALPAATINDPGSNTQIPMPGLMRDILRKSGATHSIEQFPSNALLLHDGIHASAFGRMNYIYRAKGVRIYLFDNDSIGVFSVYCTIDEHGFQLANEEIDTIALGPELPPESIQQLFTYVGLTNTQRQTESLIQMLCGLNTPFEPHYFIEYVFPPPDVQRLSVFSQQMRRLLWECVTKDIQACAAKGKGLNEQTKHSLDLLSRLDIAAPAGILLDLVVRLASSGTAVPELSTIVTLLSELRDHVIPVTEKRLADQIRSLRPDVVELKPNVAGIGVNVSEAIRRVAEWLNKT